MATKVKETADAPTAKAAREQVAEKQPGRPEKAAGPLRLPSYLFVSARAKQALEEAGIRGVQFWTIDKIRV